MRSGGRMVLAVPRGVDDKVVFNLHRIYGPLQMAHLLANWDQVYQEPQPGWQGGIVVEKGMN